jgi:hypothetical protein
MEITAEQIAAALRETASSPSYPMARIEIVHGGIDRKNRSERSERSFRDAIRRAIVVAKHQSGWPHEWSEAKGGQRVTKAEIRIVAHNSRSWGTQSESVLRYELSGRFGLYDERSSGEIVDVQKKRGDGEAMVIVTVRAIEAERVLSFAERVEAGEVGQEPDYTPFGICVCGHPHYALACTESECFDFVRDPSVPSPFVAGGFNDPAAQIATPAEELPRVQSPRDEDPSPEEIEDEDLRMAVLARMMRGDVAVSGGGGARGRVRRDKRVQRDLQAKYDYALQDERLSRPEIAEGRVSVGAHEALYAQEVSVGEILEDIGQRLRPYGAQAFSHFAAILDTVAPRADRAHRDEPAA